MIRNMRILPLKVLKWSLSGLISILLFFTINVLAFLHSESLFEEVIPITAPFFFVTLLGLGLRGDAPSAAEVNSAFAIAIAVTLASYFLLGIVVHWLYLKIMRFVRK